MNEGKPTSRERPHASHHDKVEVNTREKPFDAVDFIALYRIAEREVFRNPADQYWGKMVREAQEQVLEPIWRGGASSHLDEKSRLALDLFMCVLEREGKPSVSLCVTTVLSL